MNAFASIAFKGRIYEYGIFCSLEERPVVCITIAICFSDTAAIHSQGIYPYIVVPELAIVDGEIMSGHWVDPKEIVMIEWGVLKSYELATPEPTSVSGEIFDRRIPYCEILRTERLDACAIARDQAIEYLNMVGIGPNEVICIRPPSEFDFRNVAPVRSYPQSRLIAKSIWHGRLRCAISDDVQRFIE